MYSRAHRHVDCLLLWRTDNKFISEAQPALERKEKVFMEFPVNNLNRTAGTMLSYNVSKAYGEDGTSAPI